MRFNQRSNIWSRVAFFFSFFLSLVFICTAFLSITGCAGGTPENLHTEQQAIETQSSKEEHVIIGVTGSPTLFNPLYSTDTVSKEMENLLYDGLVGMDEHLNLELRMAEDWNASDDGLTYTFTLKEGIEWHDGRELTAEDVAFTFNIPLDKDYDGPRSSSFETLESVTAVDRYTVQFQLKQPDARFIWTASYSILPEHILGNVPVSQLEEHAFNRQNPIGTGPFKFKEWIDGQYVQWERFEDYYAGTPRLDSITFKIVPDQNALLAQMYAGGIDIADIPANDIETAQKLEDQGKITLFSRLGYQYHYMGYNLRHEWFKDLKVRQAITHALNREEIIEAVVEGEGEVAHAPVSPLSWAYDPDIPHFDYDPQKARQLLHEAGWQMGEDGILTKDGERFSFELKTNQGNRIREDMMVVIQQQLRQVGIEVRPTVMEWSAFISQISAPNWNFDAILLGWGLGADPDPSAMWHSRYIQGGLNLVGYVNPTLDQLMEENIRMTDQEERKQLLQNIFIQIAEDQPYTFLYYPRHITAVPSGMKGYIHHPKSSVYNAHLWHFDH